MTHGYSHLSFYERERLAVYRTQGYSIRAIASLLNRTHSTISRELKRNKQAHVLMTGYIAPLAHKVAIDRKKKAGQRHRLKCQFIREYTKGKLQIGWSP